METRDGYQKWIYISKRQGEGGGAFVYVCVCGREGGWVVGNNEFDLHIPIFFTRVVNINKQCPSLASIALVKPLFCFGNVLLLEKLQRAIFYNSQLVGTAITNDTSYIFIHTVTNTQTKGK